MEKRVVVLLMMVVLVAGGATQVFAFGPGGGHGPKGEGQRGPEGRLQIMAEVLDLSEAQQVQIKEVFAGEREAMQPYREQMRESRQQMHDLVQSDSFDEARIRSLAAQTSGAKVEMMVSKARTFNQIYNLLTPEQQALAKKLEPLLKNRHQGL